MTRKKISRRSFFKKSAVASAGMFAFPYVVSSAALGAGAAVAPSERITLGHIGVGGQGGGVLNGFLNLNDCQSVAVCDAFENRRDDRASIIEKRYAEQKDRADYKGCDKYADFRDLLARDDIDAVVIATPDHWHVPIAMVAARAGKDMYVEKPLGVSVQENKELRGAIHRYGNIFQYGTQQRSFSTHCAYACELVRNGHLGKLKEIHVDAPGGGSGGSTVPIDVPQGLDYDMWLGPAPWSPYTSDRCKSGGTYFVYDNSLGFIAGWGAHPLDIMHWGYPHIPIEYEGTGEIPTEGIYTAITKWDVKGRFASGVKFFFKDGADKTTFVGEHGWVAASRGTIAAEPKSLLTSVITPREIHLLQNPNHHQNFIDAVKTRNNPVSDIDSAVQSDFVSHLSDIAIRTGRKITWDEEKETIVSDKAAERMLTRPMRSPWRL